MQTSEINELTGDECKSDKRMLNTRKPADAAEGHQRFVENVKSSHSALNLLTISHLNRGRRQRSKQLKQRVHLFFQKWDRMLERKHLFQCSYTVCRMLHSSNNNRILL